MPTRGRTPAPASHLHRDRASAGELRSRKRLDFGRNRLNDLSQVSERARKIVRLAPLRQKRGQVFFSIGESNFRRKEADALRCASVDEFANATTLNSTARLCQVCNRIARSSGGDGTSRLTKRYRGGVKGPSSLMIVMSVDARRHSSRAKA